MVRQDERALSYNERLATFEGYWDGREATARQLAAIGHVSDRPPLETLEEGSRCVTCSHFVQRATSITFLEGNVNPEHFDTLVVPDFHAAGCVRLQIRLPFATPRWFMDSSSKPLKTRIQQFEQAGRAALAGEAQESARSCRTSLLSLPTEIRLLIYEYTLPPLDSITDIVQIDRDSMRVTTAQALGRPRRHDPTQSSILRVCRTMHAEVLDLVYSNTTFTFTSSKLLYMFLRRIGKLARSRVRSIDVRCGQREDAIAFALLSSCEGVERIVIRLCRVRLLPPYAPLWIEDGVACLLGLSGLHSVQFAMSGAQIGLHDRLPDAALIRQELMRERDSPSMITTVNGLLNV